VGWTAVVCGGVRWTAVAWVGAVRVEIRVGIDSMLRAIIHHTRSHVSQFTTRIVNAFQTDTKHGRFKSPQAVALESRRMIFEHSQGRTFHPLGW
jgi:hypothetical protein